MSRLQASSGDVLFSNATIDSAIVMSTGGGTFQGWEQEYPYDLARRIIALSCFVEGIVTQKHIVHQSEDAARAQQETEKLQITGQFLKNLPISFIEDIAPTSSKSLDAFLRTEKRIIEFFFKRSWHQNNFPTVELPSDLLTLLTSESIKNLLSALSTDEADPFAIMSIEAFLAIDASRGYGIPLLANAYEYPAFLMDSMDLAECNTYELKVPSIFSAILKRCRHHLDILKTTLQFRAVKASQALQELFVSIDNEESLANFDKEINKIQEFADELAEEIDEVPRMATARFIITSIPKETFTHRKRRLIFCLNSFQEESTLRKIKEPISQIFNVDGEITISVIKELLV